MRVFSARGCFLVIATAGAVLAASTWQPDGASGGNKKVPIACGGVTGDLGCIWGWVQVSAPENTIFSHANIGYAWNGNQFLLKQMPEKTAEDVHYHNWEKSGGGAADRNTFQVAADFQAVSSGSATRLQAGTWAWSPNLIFEYTMPSAERRPPGFANWIPEEWTVVHNSTAPVFTSRQTNDGATAQPTSTLAGGHFRASLQIVAVQADGTKVRFKFPWKVKATASVDNANVSNWLEAVHYDAQSHVTDAAPEQSFNPSDIWN